MKFISPSLITSQHPLSFSNVIFVSNSFYAFLSESTKHHYSIQTSINDELSDINQQLQIQASLITVVEGDEYPLQGSEIGHQSLEASSSQLELGHLGKKNLTPTCQQFFIFLAIIAFSFPFLRFHSE